MYVLFVIVSLGNSTHIVNYERNLSQKNAMQWWKHLSKVVNTKQAVR